MPSEETKIDTLKKPVPQDWHKADVKCALEKRGYSFVKVSRLNGYCKTAAQNVVRAPWPKMERIVATAIGVAPQEIWPSRYHEDGTPKSGRFERGGLGFKSKKRKASQLASKHSTTRRTSNVKEMAVV